MSDSFKQSDPKSKLYWRKFDTEDLNGESGPDNGLNADEMYDKRVAEMEAVLSPEYAAAKGGRESWLIGKQKDQCDMSHDPHAPGTRGAELRIIPPYSEAEKREKARQMGTDPADIPNYMGVLTPDEECHAYLQGVKNAEEKGWISPDRCEEMSEAYDGTVRDIPSCNTGKGKGQGSGRE